MPDRCISCTPGTWGTGSVCELPKDHAGPHRATLTNYSPPIYSYWLRSALWTEPR